MTEAARELADIVLSSGRIRWGEPNDSIRKRLEGITDFELIKQMMANVFTAASWEDLVPADTDAVNGSNSEN